MSRKVNKMGLGWMVWLAIPFLLYPASGQSQDLVAPMADVHPTSLEAHGDVRVDEYYWLKERDNPATIKYLEAENAYLDQVMSHTKDLQQTIFYSKQDPETLRWHRIFRHELGTDPSRDALVFEELDETFYSFVFKSKSKRYILIGSSQTLSDEYHFVDSNEPEAGFTVIQPRERDLEYSVDHLGDYFYIRANLDAENFRLMRAPIFSPSKDDWKEVIAHRPSVYLADFDLFDDFLVLSERKDGLMNLRAMRWDGTDDHYLNFGESAYLAYVSTNPETDSKILR
jgi:oligopeptidase B